MSERAYHHISRWWAFKVDVPTNPDFDHVEVKEESVLTGSMMFAGSDGGPQGLDRTGRGFNYGDGGFSGSRA
jgi:hypothetical protein